MEDDGYSSAVGIVIFLMSVEFGFNLSNSFDKIAKDFRGSFGTFVFEGLEGHHKVSFHLVRSLPCAEWIPTFSAHEEAVEVLFPDVRVTGANWAERATPELIA